jgi:cellulose synthase/poly-beta-1,6-N-acetylglucosamine synthase-like glycosyltransferase
MGKQYYLKIGSARDLSGKDGMIYRMFEILPGFLSWLTILGVIFLSWRKPVWVAFFIISFDVYWLIKTVYLSLHLRESWKKMKKNLIINWEERLKMLHKSVGHSVSGDPDTECPTITNIWQMIILPFYKESFDVVEGCVESLLNSEWPKEKMLIVLAYEERAGEKAEKIAKKISQKYKDKFGHFIFINHPKNLNGEIPGKGSNIAYAAERARLELLDRNNIKYENVLVSAFDIDTQVYPQYFFCLTYHFLTAENPYRSSFQPVPVYNNNIWYASAFSRVVAASGTFWQMMQQARPERLTTFSSHSISFKALYEVGYWQKNIVSEDSRIFWNCFLYYDGDYQTVPLNYPISMDANLAPTFWGTFKNVYKQQRRWTWGVENISYILFGFLKNKKIPLRKKIRYSFVQIEGFWSLTTNPLLIFLLGWLPLLLGGHEFNTTLLSYNLPRITRDLMNVAMLGLIGSAIISTFLLPKRPNDRKRWRYIFMVLQWLLVPFTIIFFGAIPGLDAQTRLMFGRYMNFWVTPKHR